MSDISTALMFDMRAPAFGAAPHDLYAAALEMAAYADGFGIGRINLMEHHGSDDGYLPTPFVLGGGIAARTTHARIMLGAVILPLHDPVKVAEEIAVLDLMSNGRLEVTFGAGYVPAEFAAFGVSLKQRGKLLDEGIDTILRALNGERFAAGGRPVYVRPLPVQRPEDIIYVGGGVEASARRAARFNLGFAPISPHVVPVYEAECRRLGREPKGSKASRGPIMIHLSEDPDKGWKQLIDHALHVVRAYAAWAAQEEHSNSPFAGLDSEESLRRAGLFQVMTPDQLVANAREMVGDGGTLSFMPLLGGLDPDIGWQSLELLKGAMPRLADI
jgi:alkanesulfonate monooxygenase SsuD/methylene tetrahydromethanopterin reductase-like flavin-dependent oxidoreductase (luciferase family)